MAKKYVDRNIKIFDLARLKFNELYEDSINYLRDIYKNVGEYFSNASPMGQLLRVTLHLGRMILYYIEDSITNLNINTATTTRAIKGISTLTGHNPSRGIAARGAVQLSWNQSADYSNQTITIPNFTSLSNSSNGLTYLISLPSESAQITLNGTSKLNTTIIQGEVKYQQATGDGYGLQSFNISTKNGEVIDQFFVNVYVDGERWKVVESFIDMGYQDKSCMVKTGQTGGLDIFFGNEVNGLIPRQGSTILVEYLITKGADGNITNINQNSNTVWKFNSKGYLANGEEVDLNEVLNISMIREILFGTYAETTEMTRKLAPHASRSYVLANETNYQYFLSKLNIFNVVNVVKGYATYEDQQAQLNYDSAVNNRDSLYIQYKNQVALTGKDSTQATALYAQYQESENAVNKYAVILKDSKLDDNTIYLYLVPNIIDRIKTTENYFTCSTSAFKLSDNEKSGILDLIEASGQKLLTVDNVIVDPKFANFAINVYLQIWDDADEDIVKENIISKISTYLIELTRHDRIPTSDLVALIESVDGVDSVTLNFVADSQNTQYYGDDNYGIDGYGDVILQRSIIDSYGNDIMVNDVYPLFRGGFTAVNGNYYNNSMTADGLKPINITVRGTSSKKQN